MYAITCVCIHLLQIEITQALKHNYLRSIQLPLEYDGMFGPLPCTGHSNLLYTIYPIEYWGWYVLWCSGYSIMANRFMWYVNTYQSGMLHGQWRNHVIAPVPVKELNKLLEHHHNKHNNAQTMCISMDMLMVSCQKGPTRHAYAWQIGPFWQDTLDVL